MVKSEKGLTPRLPAEQTKSIRKKRLRGENSVPKKPPEETGDKNEGGEKRGEGKELIGAREPRRRRRNARKRSYEGRGAKKTRENWGLQKGGRWTSSGRRGRQRKPF